MGINIVKVIRIRGSKGVKILSRFKFGREAILFDSPLYLLKAFLGVMICYLLFSQHRIIGKDMISVLFGMMLSLEPVNISGLKSGIAQFEATILGGIVTAVIVMIAGVNIFTVPLAVMMTLYISILLDWKNISPVAFFTSIYMTQLVQFTANGEPSMLLTLRLRLMALGAGVILAILLNFIFSLLFYQSMIRKRTLYLFERFVINLTALERVLDSNDMQDLSQLKNDVSALFTDIDFIYDHGDALSKEKKKAKELSGYLGVIRELRLMNHYYYDLILETFSETGVISVDENYYKQLNEIKDFLSCFLVKEDSSKSMIPLDEYEKVPFKKLYNCMIRIENAYYIK